MTQSNLYLGDCLEIMDKLIAEEVKVDAVICDPPYGSTACKWDNVIPFNEIWSRLKKLRKVGTNIIIFSKQPFTTMLNYSNISEYRYEIIWKKQQATNPMCAKKRVMPIHENISVFYDKLKTYNPQMRIGYSNYKSFNSENKNIGEIYGLKSRHRNCEDGSRYPISVWEYNNVRKAVHPTQKPIELMEELVKTYTNENDLVIDFTMGSGTTGIACKKFNRNFIGIESDEKYFNIAIERIMHDGQ